MTWRTPSAGTQCGRHLPRSAARSRTRCRAPWYLCVHDGRTAPTGTVLPWCTQGRSSARTGSAPGVPGLCLGPARSPPCKAPGGTGDPARQLLLSKPCSPNPVQPDSRARARLLSSSTLPVRTSVRFDGGPPGRTRRRHGAHASAPSTAASTPVGWRERHEIPWAAADIQQSSGPQRI
jgi:hypothetical protein